MSDDDRFLILERTGTVEICRKGTAIAGVRWNGPKAWFEVVKDGEVLFVCGSVRQAVDLFIQSRVPKHERDWCWTRRRTS